MHDLAHPQEPRCVEPAEPARTRSGVGGGVPYRRRPWRSPSPSPDPTTASSTRQSKNQGCRPYPQTHAPPSDHDGCCRTMSPIRRSHTAAATGEPQQLEICPHGIRLTPLHPHMRTTGDEDQCGDLLVKGTPAHAASPHEEQKNHATAGARASPSCALGLRRGKVGREERWLHGR